MSIGLPIWHGALLGDFVLHYPVYALLFADAGLSTAEIQSLFAVWSLTGLCWEVPSGSGGWLLRGTAADVRSAAGRH